MSLAEAVVQAGLDEAAIEERKLLKRDIRNRLVQLKKLTELGVTGGLDDSLEDVNLKIDRYNEISLAPQPAGKVSRDTFVAQIAAWE